LTRNNTGFWILQQCQRQWERQSSFSSLSQKARHTKRPASIFDPESADFQNPGSTLDSIKRFAVRTNQTPPQTRGDYTRSIYASLALQVRWCVERLGEILGTRLDRIHLLAAEQTTRSSVKSSPIAPAFPCGPARRKPPPLAMLWFNSSPQPRSYR
jgi:rhamnulokinase